MRSADSIGIIGGADGPTTIVVSSGLHWYEIAAIVVAVAIAAYIVICAIRKNRHK